MNNTLLGINKELLHSNERGILTFQVPIDDLVGGEQTTLEYQFDWDPIKDQQNHRKHRLTFRQAATVFRDPNQLSLYDDEHSDDEDRWITIGLDRSGVVRVEIHTFEQHTPDVVAIRIISARTASPAEAQQYRREDV